MHPSDQEGPAPRTQEASGGVEPGLLVAERRHRIVELLRAQGKVTVEALAARFATSAVTIRTDLAALEAGGALERTHGGALLRQDNDDRPINVKRTLHHAEKVRIAKAAAALIQDGETVILDSGTTTAEIAKQIRRLEVQSINVITNALNIAALLTDIQADRLFLGADGLDPERGVMTPHLPEAQLNAKMIEISRQVIVVADSSKLMRRNISLIARVEQLHMIITDAGADPDVVAELRRRGVEVRLA